VRMVGWVPSVLPYLHHTRVMVVPLQYGAGTKRKLVQSLLAGTPAVSTTVGVEGLDLSDGEHVLVADSPDDIAAGIARLLSDNELWQRLAIQGRDHIAARHGRGTARNRFLEVVHDVLAREPKLAPPVPAAVTTPEAYRALVERIRQVAGASLPPGATVLVVSRGDDSLLDLGSQRGRHFPQTEQGVYAGHYPADSAAAVAHLEDLRGKGAEYLLFPQTAFWWLDHYADLRDHLHRRHDEVWADQDCVIFRLTQKETALPIKPIAPEEIERLRPVVRDLPATNGPNGDHPGKRVLALGVYLANQPNTVADVVANLAGSSLRVTQRWVALWGTPPSETVAAVTVRTELRKVPKFELLNELLAAEDLSQYDYVLLFDDDIVLPNRFLDRFLPLQHRLDFVIAQPARTSNSYIDLPIVEEQRGCLARQTRFVEIGPVVSFHRSVFNLVFPFDLTSPMGWGYENVWSYELVQRKLKMGIIDAVPVDHSIRKPVTNYKWSEADAQRKKLFKKHKHYTYDECFRVLAAIPLGRGDDVAGA
jgi:Glycosyl transferases group 1